MKVLVTGGGGFLGTVICRLLHERGDDVVSLTRESYPWLEWMKVRQVRGDIASLDAVLGASKGCHAIIHTAAKAGAWGRLEDYYTTNVTGTANVLAACSLNAIPKLVYTSTPSVVHTGVDLMGRNESLPYAEHFLAHYPATKAIAERRVLAANTAELSTVALRPHLIWGPGDNHLLPRLVARAKAGRLRFIGKEPKKIDVTFVDNAAQAHLNALDRLAPGAVCAGKSYFLSQGEPIDLDKMVNFLLQACGLPPETRRLPYKLAYNAGALLERIYGLLRIESEPPMTRFVANQLATAHWFDITAAKRELGYVPSVSINQGLGKVAEWWKKEGARS